MSVCPLCGAATAKPLGLSLQGNALVRWAAVEAVQRNCEPSIRAVRDGIIARRGKDARNTAKVAAGRVMLEAVYYLLRDGHSRRLHPAVAA